MAYRSAALAGDVTSISRQATDALSTTAAEIRSAESAAYEVTLDSLRTDLQSTRAEVATAATNLQSTRATLATSESRRRELEQEISALERSVESLATDLENSRSTEIRRVGEISSLENIISDRELTIQELADTLETGSAKNDSLETELEEQNRTVTELVESLSTNESRAARLQSTLETTDESPTASVAELASTELALAELQIEFDMLKSVLADTAAEAQADKEALVQARADIETEAAAAADAIAADSVAKAAAAAESAAQILAEARANAEADAALATAEIVLLEETLAETLDESAQQEGALQGQVAALLGQITDASNRLDENATEIVDLIAEIESLEKRVDTLGTENVFVSTRANELLGSVNELESMLAAALIPPDSVLEERELVDQFGAFKDKGEELLEGNAINRFELASAEFASFLSETGDLAFPGIARMRSRILVGLIAALDATAVEAGGRTALNEVLRYVNYLGAGDSGSLSSRLAFEALAEKDLLYRRVFTNLDELAGVEIVASNLLTLVGSVTGFTDGIVEFDLDQGLVPRLEGSVIVRRIDGDGNENSVAQGVIDSIDENSSRARADVRLYLDPIPPIDGDLVYTESSTK